MVSTRAQSRIRTARRSTLLGLLGIALMAVGLVLTAVRVGGLVAPTVVALVGLLLLVAGIATGARLVFDNFRFRRDQPFEDPDEEDDE